MRKRVLAIGLTLAVLMTTVVWFVQPHDAFAADNRGQTICLSNGSNQCLDLKDDTFTTDQSIIWYNVNQGKGLGWNLAKQGTVGSNTPFMDPQWDTR